ncbi:hypothetical protein PRZ48_007547 [Zasmidium cellare]|uniref:Uncharacterized protein n=1 Tax=Zasmidium cellare TaxID=395010 RepID=A0ABR0EKJ5_ZASCE|nr:hypothetical protein PRZ48_007547 [Zasmidium cellare]
MAAAANLFANGGGSERLNIIRSRIQFSPTPPVTPGPLRLPANDEHATKADTKSAAEIFPTEKPEIPVNWDSPRLKRGVNMTWLLKGNVTKDDLRLLAGDLPEREFEAMYKADFKPYLKTTLQNSMFGTGESSWLMSFISAEVQLEDLKVHAFNLYREAHLLRLREEGQSEQQHAEALAQANNCMGLCTELLNNAVAKYDEEIKGLTEGTKSPFRFGERTGKFAKARSGLDAIIKDEVLRIQGIRNNLHDYPRSQFRIAGVPEPVALANQVPAKKVIYAMRAPSVRHDFWRSRASLKVIVSYCRAHLPYVEVHQMNTPAWRNKIMKQFMLNCDLAFFTVVEPRLETERLKHVEDRRLRVNTCEKSDRDQYFTQMRSFHQQYINRRLHGNLPVPTMSDLRVKRQDTMDGSHDRAREDGFAAARRR